LQHSNGLYKGLKEIDDMNVNAPASLSGTMDVDEFMAFMETRPKEEHWDLIEGVAVMMNVAALATAELTTQ
jgi:hypothetical protein